MYNSEHFSHAQERELRTKKIPTDDVEALALDPSDVVDEDAENGADAEKVAKLTHSREFIPRWLKYNDGEEWYWRYGNDVLYVSAFAANGKPPEPKIEWKELHRFLTAYAWIEPKWRFILDKPCWPFHAEVVDRIVSLYLGVKHYETQRAKVGPREHVDYREMAKYLAHEVKESLAQCKIVEAKIKEGADAGRMYCYVNHRSQVSTRGWVESLLHRVLQFEGQLLPPSPVMYATFGTVGGDDLDATELFDGDFGDDLGGLFADGAGEDLDSAVEEDVGEAGDTEEPADGAHDEDGDTEEGSDGNGG